MTFTTIAEEITQADKMAKYALILEYHEEIIQEVRRTTQGEVCTKLELQPSNFSTVLKILYAYRDTHAKA